MGPWVPRRRSLKTSVSELLCLKNKWNHRGCADTAADVNQELSSANSANTPGLGSPSHQANTGTCTSERGNQAHCSCHCGPGARVWLGAHHCPSLKKHLWLLEVAASLLYLQMFKNYKHITLYKQTTQWTWNSSHSAKFVSDLHSNIQHGYIILRFSLSPLAAVGLTSLVEPTYLRSKRQGTPFC